MSFGGGHRRCLYYGTRLFDAEWGLRKRSWGLPANWSGSHSPKERAKGDCFALGPITGASYSGQNSPASTLTSNPRNVSTTPTQFTIPVPSPSKETVQTFQELWQRSREGLTPTQHQQLWEVLARNQDIFAVRDEDCGRTRLVQHDIDTV